MKTMDQLSPAELREWVNGTYRAQHDVVVTDVQGSAVEGLTRDYRLGFGLADRLKSVLGSLPTLNA